MYYAIDYPVYIHHVMCVCVYIYIHIHTYVYIYILYTVQTTGYVLFVLHSILLMYCTLCMSLFYILYWILYVI